MARLPARLSRPIGASFFPLISVVTFNNVTDRTIGFGLLCQIPVVMIGLVLVQHGKGADMGASFGSGADVQMIFERSGLIRPCSIMAVRLRL